MCDCNRRDQSHGCTRDHGHACGKRRAKGNLRVQPKLYHDQTQADTEQDRALCMSRTPRWDARSQSGKGRKEKKKKKRLKDQDEARIASDSCLGSALRRLSLLPNLPLLFSSLCTKPSSLALARSVLSRPFVSGLWTSFGSVFGFCVCAGLWL